MIGSSSFAVEQSWDRRKKEAVLCSRGQSHPLGACGCVCTSLEQALKICGEDKFTPFLFSSLIYYPFLPSLTQDLQGQEGPMLLARLLPPPSHSRHLLSTHLDAKSGQHFPCQIQPVDPSQVHTPVDILFFSLLLSLP